MLRFERRAGRILGVLGAAAGVAMALVGVVPVDVLEPHIVVAAVAFLLILATALWFAVWCLRGDAPYPRWLGWFAAVVVTLVVVFMLVPRILQPEFTFEMEYNLETPRPDVLLNSTFEWSWSCPPGSGSLASPSTTDHDKETSHDRLPHHRRSASAGRDTR